MSARHRQYPDVPAARRRGPQQPAASEVCLPPVAAEPFRPRAVAVLLDVAVALRARRYAAAV
jgi:hypothetical protein